MDISISRPILGSEEILAVSRVIESGMIASGPETAQFEKEFSEFVGSKFACAVNNGTSALSLSLSALGIGPGDEVITTPFTFVATANSILSCGAKPVFADIDEYTFNLSPESARKKITEKTKAIMPVHLYGLPADMGAFREIASHHGLNLVGDAAQAHGAKLGERRVGSLGDLECFSFYPTKNMTTGEGGMVTTDNEDLFSKLISIRNHGRVDGKLGTYGHERFGLNLRLTDIGSAIGRVQLMKLNSFNEIRTKNSNKLSEILNDLEGVVIPETPSETTHAWHQYTIRVPDRVSLSKHLSDNGIGFGIYYPGLIQDYPHLEKFKSSCPVAEKVVLQVLSLPIHPGLTEDDIIRIGECVRSWSLNRYG